jgi:hypothetical protein
MEEGVPQEWKETEQRVFSGEVQSPVSLGPADLDAFEPFVKFDDDGEMDIGNGGFGCGFRDLDDKEQFF